MLIYKNCMLHYFLIFWIQWSCSYGDERQISPSHSHKHITSQHLLVLLLLFSFTKVHNEAPFWRSLTGVYHRLTDSCSAYKPEQRHHLRRLVHFSFCIFESIWPSSVMVTEPNSCCLLVSWRTFTVLWCLLNRTGCKSNLWNWRWWKTFKQFINFIKCCVPTYHNRHVSHHSCIHSRTANKPY